MGKTYRKNKKEVGQRRFKFSARVSGYQKSYGVHEVRRSIAEQMREAGTLAKEKALDKVREIPGPHRGRDREER